MKKLFCIFFSLIIAGAVNAQNNSADSVEEGVITVTKDPRLDLLARKEAEINGMSAKAAKGFRLLVLKSNDREYAMKVRAALLQNFPDQKVYMSFEAPFIKLKFGNFTEKADAEKYRVMLMKGKFVTNNVYVVPEVVEVKPDKNKDTEND